MVVVVVMIVAVVVIIIIIIIVLVTDTLWSSAPQGFVLVIRYLTLVE